MTNPNQGPSAPARQESPFPQRLRGSVPPLGALVLGYDVIVMVVAIYVAYRSYCLQGLFTDPVLSRIALTLSSGALGGAMLSSRWVVLAIRHGTYDARRLPWQVLAPV